MTVITNLDIKNDLNDIARLFNIEGNIKIDCNIKNNNINTIIEYKDKIYKNIYNIDTKDELIYKRLFKRYTKKHLYDVLKSHNNVNLPWGSLTGIRPVKLFSNTVKETDQKKAEEYFEKFYDVSKNKLNLIKEIYNIQNKFSQNQNRTGLYIGIPFCKGRCSYCSFFSADIDKNRNLIDGYVTSLIQEIKCIKEIILKNNIKINSIYVGGGTPSSLPINYLKNILDELKDINNNEFTVEAGRPDSINNELLDVLKQTKVTRISINPQTANDKTLQIIGRRHTYNDFLKAFEFARQYDFIINTDIIAGLPQENITDFNNTVDNILKVMPENITVHTLAIKQGAKLKIDGYKHLQNADKMLDYANSMLHKHFYNAYYMYRQKNTAGNLENTGYCQEAKECLYNIDNMSDEADIIACGADAVSKRIFSAGRIERQGNPKDIKTYCNNIETIINNKKIFLMPKK